jgi:hypothetical protein
MTLSLAANYILKSIMLSYPRVASRKALSFQLGRWQAVCGRSTLFRTADHEQKDNRSPLVVNSRPYVSTACEFSESNLREIKKDTKAELIKALKNILDIQKALSIKSGVLPMSGDELSEQKSHSVLSWKESVDKAIRSKNIQRAIELFYFSPNGIEVSKNTSIYDTYKNLIFRVNALETETAFDIFDASEDFYAHAQEIVHGSSLVKLVNCRQQILKRVIKVISQTTPQSDPNCRLGQTLSYLSTTIQCITEPNLQHELYPLLMSSLMKKPVVSIVKKSIKLTEIEEEIWDSAIYSLKMMDRNFATENPRIIEHYDVLLYQSSYRKQKRLPFVFLMTTLLGKGEFC